MDFLHGIKWIMFHGHLDYFQKPPLGGSPNLTLLHSSLFLLFFSHVWVYTCVYIRVYMCCVWGETPSLNTETLSAETRQRADRRTSPTTTTSYNPRSSCGSRRTRSTTTSNQGRSYTSKAAERRKKRRRKDSTPTGICKAKCSVLFNIRVLLSTITMCACTQLSLPPEKHTTTSTTLNFYLLQQKSTTPNIHLLPPKLSLHLHYSPSLNIAPANALAPLEHRSEQHTSAAQPATTHQPQEKKHKG